MPNATVSISEVADALRARIGVPSGFVSPEALARCMRLELVAGFADRVGLFGDRAVFDRHASLDDQQYQIARAACAWALCQAGLIDAHSPHDLAVELCGVRRNAERGTLRPVARVVAINRSRPRHRLDA